jgi:MarR family transcriptional regulator for hemolysin
MRKPPLSPDHVLKNLMPMVAQSARQWRRAIDRQLQPLGLTEATWLPLLHLSRAAEAPRQKDLASALQLDSSSVVRLLDNLQAAGFIQREEGQDRRAKTVVLTAAGRSVVDQVEAVIDVVRAKYLGSLPQADLAIAFRIVRHISDMLTNDLEPAP